MLKYNTKRTVPLPPLPSHPPHPPHPARTLMPLYFIRHGESQANEQNRFAGRLDAPLTTLGLRQAEQAADRVAALAASGIRIDEVHTSTLRRAQETARTITDRLPE